MAIIQDLIDEHQQLAQDRSVWEMYWRQIAMYVLPQTEGFDRMFSSGGYDNAINSVVATPVAATKAKDLYNMTSLWAIERLTAGLISLKTPETDYWHGMRPDGIFDAEPSHSERVALEKLRDYLFLVRSNPMSGFWPAHRAAVKSMAAFGDGFCFVEERAGGNQRSPLRYEYIPLPEAYVGKSAEGQLNRMFRVVRWSAAQLVGKFGAEKVGSKVTAYANDPKRRHQTFALMHAVRPRDDRDRGGKMGVLGTRFSSHYCLPDEKVLIGESGYYEMPFHQFSWSNTGTRPYSEGPVAFALGEIKSLNEMSKNELIAQQTMLRPALATSGKNMTRINMNPGAVNPGLIAPDGSQLFATINGGGRPDFAQAVMERRENNVRELLYLNLWQIIIQDKDNTATEALIRAQEKGELLGPVGISMNEGLASQVDREIGVLDRKGAFRQGSPLAMPESLMGREVAPIFTSPLDRLRRMGEVIGIQRLTEYGLLLEGVKPGAFTARFDEDEAFDIVQDVLGAPSRVLRDKKDAAATRDQIAQATQAQQGAEIAKSGGEAARLIGEGGSALAQGAEAASQAPALQRMMRGLPGIMPTDAGRPVAR